MEEIKKEQKSAPPDVSSISLPLKPPPAAGKRRDAAFTQKDVYLKTETIVLAPQKLRGRGDKTDFSVLVQHLLEVWLSSPES